MTTSRPSTRSTRTRDVKTPDADEAPGVVVCEKYRVSLLFALGPGQVGVVRGVGLEAGAIRAYGSLFADLPRHVWMRLDPARGKISEARVGRRVVAQGSAGTAFTARRIVSRGSSLIR